jgi:hypothetical protein
MSEMHTEANGPQTEKILLDVVTSLRKDPEKYKALQTALQEAKSDQARVKQLLHFATSEKELSALIPARARGTQLAWTTVTVTTVLILVSTAE